MNFPSLLGVVLLVLLVVSAFLISAAVFLTGLWGLLSALRQPTLPPFFQSHRRRMAAWGAVGMAVSGGLLGMATWRSAELRAQLLCQRRLKAMAAALHRYILVHHRFPQAERWCDALREMDPGLNFRCPLDKGSVCSYAFNRSLSGAPAEVAKRPMPFIVIFESDARRWNATDGGESWPKRERHGSKRGEGGLGWNNVVLSTFEVVQARGEIPQQTSLWQPKEEQE